MFSSSTVTVQPCRSAYLMYMRARSAANSADSSPPSPDFSSRTTSSASCGSRGANRSASWVLERVDAGFEIGDLGGERVVVGGQLPGGLEVTPGRLELAVGRDDRCDLGEPAADPAGRGRVGVQGGVGQLTLEVAVFSQQCLDPWSAGRSQWPPSPERKPAPGLTRMRQIGRRSCS